MTKELERYLAIRLKEADQEQRELFGLREQYRRKVEDENSFYEFAKHVKLVEEHKNKDGDTIPEYITMDIFNRHDDPEAYDFIRGIIKWHVDNPFD